MPIEHVKVLTTNLKTGMFVTKLDRDWLETPYRIQGFVLKSEKEIHRLRKYCDFVYIDVAKSPHFEDKPARSQEPPVLSDYEQKKLLINAKPINHKVEAKFDDELTNAQKNYVVLRKTVQGVVEDTIKNKQLDLKNVRQAVTPMVDSIMRNPDAFTWLTMMRDRDNYTYNHMVSSSIWAAALGRNLGLPIKDIQSVSLGALLFDIGKIKLPEKLLTKTEQYNEQEYAVAKQHVEFSVEVVKAVPGITDNIVNMVATHHERHDGSGYPKGLKGDDIPLFGRMAGIIDCYDAMISDRYYKLAISPHEMILHLYDWSGKQFQTELVEQFIQVLGLYPVGTLVELTDGRVGVVVSHKKASRLRPTIMLILDENKEFYREFKHLNLGIISRDEHGEPLNIQRMVQPGKYGIDPKFFYL